MHRMEEIPSLSSAAKNAQSSKKAAHVKVRNSDLLNGKVQLNKT